ncbi:transporter suffix domain-containing protein [Stenomitos frigidus]|uniref:Transporter suffix domain-containing protein n=1 Tax=Stenomitos frigidus ULC18 TaxID=2107698 RepID=A0A2T1E285_9CYAN|nr:transporter suffix domain-containing protein [Stenomitos frigidus]PSB26858.1 hypothetical protein C7B82_18595 [Stenomitos frigidus ULC18]
MKQFGFFLLVLSCLVWLAIVAVPVTPFTLGQKAALVPGLLILGEMLFWTGALLVGKKIAQQYRHWLNPRYLWARCKQALGSSVLDVWLAA